MSQENMEIVRRAYEVLTVRELSRVPEFFAPDVEVDLTLTEEARRSIR
jgi:hypothetical protein